MIIKPDKEKLNKYITEFYDLSWPNGELVENIMKELGIHDIVELEFCLNLTDKRERNAAMKMVERYLEDLGSGDMARWADAKDTLHQTYYIVPQTDEEAFL